MEKYLSLSEAKAKLNHLVDEVVKKDDEFILTKNGKPVAVIVSFSNHEGWKETQAIKADPEFYKEVKEGIKRLKEGGKTVSFEDIFGEPL